MRKGIALEKIEREIEKLAPNEQLKLVEKLIHRIRKAEPVKKSLTGKNFMDLARDCGKVKTLKNM